MTTEVMTSLMIMMKSPTSQITSDESCCDTDDPWLMHLLFHAEDYINRPTVLPTIISCPL